MPADLDLVLSGIKKIRRSYAKRTNKETAAADLKKDKDKSIKAVITASDGDLVSLLKNIEALKTVTNAECLPSLKINLAGKKAGKSAKKDASAAAVKPSAAKAAEQAKAIMDTEVESDTVNPLFFACPKTTKDGRKVSPAASDDGSFACVVLPGQKTT